MVSRRVSLRRGSYVAGFGKCLNGEMEVLTRSLLAIAWLLATIVPAMAWTEESVANNDLHGTLTVAAAGEREPVVLIVPGSGPIDRDGNMPGMRNDSLKLLAHGLAERGIGSLRIDKRGIGESKSAALRVEDLRVTNYVDDVISWIDVLRKRPDVSNVFLLGHSEGALIATLAAQKEKVSGLVLLEGAGLPIAEVLARQLAASGVPLALQEQSKRISESLKRGSAVKDVPPELAQLYPPTVQGYLMSWLPLDPAAELAKVTCPVLIVQGTTDFQITFDDAAHLQGASPGARLVAIAGMNHVLKNAPAGRVANLRTYNDANLPLEPRLVPSIVTFVHDHS